jgi:lipopolysaccharide/colanic/teichoic acid biosynthesis glycosyltransferase
MTTDTSLVRPSGVRLERVDTRLSRKPSRYERSLKPVVDRVAALVMLVVLAPLLAAVAFGVLLTLGRPVLYRQARVGQHGRTFQMLKFRTMKPDRRQAQRNYEGPDRRRTHKTPHDPRHTPFGRLLREYSLDELPQLWNVVRGDLSLVGPRPELTAIVDHYELWQHERHQVKPGLTGLWQVTERGNGLMHEHTDVDLRYVSTLSWRIDLKIMLLTLPAVLGARRGA